MASLNSLPAEIHLSLSEYLSASDIVSLSQVCQHARQVYQPLSWPKVYVCSFQLESSPQFLSRTYIQDPSYRVVPARVFFRPWKYKSVFLTGLVKQVYLSTTLFTQTNMASVFLNQATSANTTALTNGNESEIEKYPFWDPLHKRLPPLEITLVSAQLQQNTRFFLNVSNVLVADSLDYLPSAKYSFGDEQFLQLFPRAQTVSFYKQRKLNMSVLSGSLAQKLERFIFFCPESLVNDRTTNTTTATLDFPQLPTLDTLTISILPYRNYNSYKKLVKSISTWAPRLNHLSIDFHPICQDENLSLNALTYLPHTLKSCKVCFYDINSRGAPTVLNAPNLNVVTLPQVTKFSYQAPVSVSTPNNQADQRIPINPSYLEYLRMTNATDICQNFNFTFTDWASIVNLSLVTKLRLQFHVETVFSSYMMMISEDSMPNLKNVWYQLNFINRYGKWINADLDLLTEHQTSIVQCLAAAANNWQIVAKAQEELWKGGNLKDLLKQLEPSFPESHKNCNDSNDNGITSPYYLSYKLITDLAIFPMMQVANINLFIGEGTAETRAESSNSAGNIDYPTNHLGLLLYFYASMEAVYDRLLKFRKLETAVVDSAFSIDFSPAFQRLIHTHNSLKALFVSEYQEQMLPSPSSDSLASFIKKERANPKIINNKYMNYTSPVLVAEDAVYRSGNLTNRFANVLGKSHGRYDYEQCPQFCELYNRREVDYFGVRRHPVYNNGNDDSLLADSIPAYFTFPRIMSKIDVEGMRNKYFAGFEHGTDYYYDKKAMSLEQIKQRLSGTKDTDKASLTSQEAFVQRMKELDTERIQRHISLASAFEEQYLGKQERERRSKSKGEKQEEYARPSTKFMEMLPLINYDNIDVYGV